MCFAYLCTLIHCVLFMELFIKISQFLLSLSLLIVLHEGGHYLAARLFKTRVEKFYLFFDFLFPFSNLAKFSLFKWKKGDTEYGLGWFPLGGYVKIAGMVDETTQTEDLKSVPEPWEYRAKKAWQRLIIILGGIIVNLVLGFKIYIFIFWFYGESIVPPQNLAYGLHFPSEQSKEAGLQEGDIIIKVNQTPVRHFESATGMIILEEASSITVTRMGENIEIPLSAEFRNHLISTADQEPLFIPRIPLQVKAPVSGSAAEGAGVAPGDRIIAVNEVSTPFLHEFLEEIQNHSSQMATFTLIRNKDTLFSEINVSEEGTIGIELERDLSVLGIQVNTQKFSLLEAIPAGLSRGVKVIGSYVQQFKLIFNPSTGAYKKVRGFAGIASMFPSTWSWQTFWNTTALLSLILAFMNFLPIPGLDGGYMIFILYEMLRGKPPGDKFLEKANTIGFFIIIALLLYANLNDVFILFKK
jgi:regulator of sigma E protease